MRSTNIRTFYGLTRPFNFNVAIPFLLNLFVLGVIFAACAFLFFRGGLNMGTARFYFFLYLACLLVIGAALSKTSKLSYVILVWCTIELSLALGSQILAKRRDLGSLFPENVASTEESEEFAFIYHPLLQIVPRPNWRYTDFLDFTDIEDKAKAAGLDVPSLQGQKLDFVHNSLGFRGKELTEDDLAKDLIFVYGGSTTYDIGVTQGETWVEHLQSDLDNRYTILNFGVPGHTTVEHLIQTAFYQNVVKKRPVCTIYYVGWNDMVNAHIEHLDSAYADFHLVLHARRRRPIFLAQYSPLFFLANGLAMRRFDTVPQAPKIFGKPPVAGPDEHLEAIFIGHIKTIVAINEARGIKTIFIGQILNRRWSDPPRVGMPLVKEGDLVPLVERLKSILKSTSASIGAKYIDPGITNFEGNDFLDAGHFAAQGSRKFAALVSKEVGDYCR